MRVFRVSRKSSSSRVFGMVPYAEFLRSGGEAANVTQSCHLMGCRFMGR